MTEQELRLRAIEAAARAGAVNDEDLFRMARKIINFVGMELPPKPQRLPRGSRWNAARKAFLKERWVLGDDNDVILRALNQMPGERITKAQMKVYARHLGVFRPDHLRPRRAAV